MNRCCEKRLRELENTYGIRKEPGRKTQKTPIQFFYCKICSAINKIEVNINDKTN